MMMSIVIFRSYLVRCSSEVTVMMINWKYNSWGTNEYRMLGGGDTASKAATCMAEKSVGG
jgi:hypothetical protein